MLIEYNPGYHSYILPQRKIDDEVSLETKIAIRQRSGRSASVTEDDERITFSWENMTVQATLRDGGGGRFKKCCGRTEETTRNIKTIIKNGDFVNCFNIVVSFK